VCGVYAWRVYVCVMCGVVGGVLCVWFGVCVWYVPVVWCAWRVCVVFMCV